MEGKLPVKSQLVIYPEKLLESRNVELCKADENAKIEVANENKNLL